MNCEFNWDAQSFFQRLTESNRFAQESGYVFRCVSGLDGFHGAITNALQTKAMVAVSDTSEGGLRLDNTPHTSRIKTVFLFFRHKAADESARNKAMANMRELFRQFMSVLIQEKVRLEEGGIYLDQRIAFKEVERYFYANGACAYFQLRIDTYTNLEYDPDEWIDQPLMK